MMDQRQCVHTETFVCVHFCIYVGVCNVRLLSVHVSTGTIIFRLIIADSFIVLQRPFVSEVLDL